MYLIINPGSGPVTEATEQNAISNMKQYIKDCPCATSFLRVPEADYGEGRYAFDVFYEPFPGSSVQVQMPGLLLDQVRYTGEPGQSILVFPRLYVDDASWIWMFGLIGPEYWESDEEE